MEEVAQLPNPLREATRRVFVADGDALVMPMSTWRPLLKGLGELLPNLERVSSVRHGHEYRKRASMPCASASQAGGLSMLYIGPESGDDVTLKRIAKGMMPRLISMRRSWYTRPILSFGDSSLGDWS